MEGSREIRRFLTQEEFMNKNAHPEQTIKDFLAKYDRVAKLDTNYYRIVPKLQTEIWRIRNKSNSKMCMMRIMRSNGSKDIFRAFGSQIAIQRRITHPNIEEIVDYFETADTFYIVTEYAMRRNLKELISSRSKLSEVEAGEYFVQVCDILQFTAEHNLVLRDLRPENMIIDEKQHLKLINLAYCIETSSYDTKMYITLLIH